MKSVSVHKQLVNIIATAYGITVAQIVGKVRTAKIADARQVTAYLMRELFHLSFPQIGAALGGRDHSTIIYAHQKVAHDLIKKHELRVFVDSILRSTYTGNEAEISSASPWKYVPYKNAQEFETSEDIASKKINLNLTARESKIMKEYRQGLTLEEMGGHFGITRERVRQISRRALIKELGSFGQQGMKVNIKEYLLAEKKARMARRNQIPENIRQSILSEIGLLDQTKIEDIAKKYEINIDKLKKEFPEVRDYLAKIAQEKKQRWSRYYIKCRQCGTQQVPHKIVGYCVNCYPKSERFKEQQRRSHEKHRDQRIERNRTYAAEYSKRPEVIEKFRKNLDIKFFDGNRERAIERDGYKCTRCGIERNESIKKNGRDFYVTRLDGNPHNNSLANLKTICFECFNNTLGERLRNKRDSRQYRLV